MERFTLSLYIPITFSPLADTFIWILYYPSLLVLLLFYTLTLGFLDLLFFSLTIVKRPVLVKVFIERSPLLKNLRLKCPVFFSWSHKGKGSFHVWVNKTSTDLWWYISEITDKTLTTRGWNTRNSRKIFRFWVR